MQRNDTAPCTLTSLGPCGLHPDRSEPNRSNSFCTPRPPFWGRGGGCPRKRSGWRGERAGHSSGGAFPFRAASSRADSTRHDPTRHDTTRTN